MAKFEFQELGMLPITNLPEGWSLFDYRNHGKVETSFSLEIEYKVFIYMHESVIATVKIYPSTSDIRNGQHGIRLEMRLEFILGNFLDRRLFDTYEKAEIWALGFMSRFHNYHSSGEKVKRTVGDSP